VTYALGEAAATSFLCTDGTNGTGIVSCMDQSDRPSGAPLDTSTIGPHTFEVTARSSDGLTTTSTITYQVAQAPTARIIIPSGGGAYARGQSVRTSFTCSEGAAGTGLRSCKDSNRAASPGGRLKTGTAGAFTYTVTALSWDGLYATASIQYTVVRLVVAALRLSPHAIVPAGGGPTITPHRSAARISYTDSLAGRTTFRVVRCSGLLGCAPVGSFSRMDRAGRNAFWFTGRVGGHALGPGAYVLEARASHGGVRSRTVRKTFVVL
jgi:hypothetical protein